MAAVLAHAMRIKRLGNVAYLDALEAMRAFTARRDETSDDELWLLEHPPVYTLGLGADAAHGPRLDNGIPVVKVERGGEITYHGPGQAVLYTLVDLARRELKVRAFVAVLEQSVIDLLGEHGVRGERHPGAPGVYVDGAKVAALGVRVARGRAFHGLALNVDVDLGPFAEIDPCGYPGLAVTRTRDLGIAGTPDELGGRLAEILAAKLGHA
jgi:lipoyl(octanoyl) transferase